MAAADPTRIDGGSGGAVAPPTELSGLHVPTIAGALPSAPLPGVPAPGLLAGHLSLAAVQIVFGLFPVIGLGLMAEGVGFTPWAIVAWRIVFGAAALGALAFAFYGRAAMPRPRDLGALAVHAVTGIVLNQGLFVYGLAHSTAMNAGMLICLIPVFTFVVAVLAGREEFRARRAIGTAIALVATIPLVTGEGAALRPEHTFGNLLMIGNMVSYSVFLVYSKPLLVRYPSLVVIAWVYILSLPWLPLFMLQGPLAPAAPTAATWWAFAYVLVCSTVLAYLLNTFALSRLTASTTAFYVFAQPFITAVSAHLVRGETLDRSLVPAAAGLFVGLVLVAYRRSPQRAPRSPS